MNEKNQCTHSHHIHNPRSKLNGDTSEDKLKWSLKHLVSGAIGGIVSRTATAPLDRIKVYLQINGLSKHTTLGAIAGSMYREGGLRCFWRGNGVNVLKVGPTSALTFMTYDSFKQILQEDSNVPLTMPQRFAAGAMAGVLSSTITYPLDTLKTRLVLRSTSQYRGLLHTAKSIYHDGGIRVFYRGVVPNALGVIPYAGIELALYESLKNKWKQQHAVLEPNVAVLLGCVFMSSSVGQIVTYPLALVRTKMQVPPTADAPTSMTGIIRFIFLTQGIRGFYYGILPNFLKALPSVCINYIVYEKCRSQFGVTMR